MKQTCPRLISGLGHDRGTDRNRRASDYLQAYRRGRQTQAAKCSFSSASFSFFSRSHQERIFQVASTGDYKLRSWLEERLQPYVLAVPKNQRIGLTHRADEVVASWPVEAWQHLSAGEGSQGPRLYDWAWQSLDFRWTEPGWKQWLLARRSLSDPCGGYLGHPFGK